MRIKKYWHISLCVLTNLILTPSSWAAPVDKLMDIYMYPDKYPDYVVIGAHRGYWKDVPENSLAAIEAAIDLGVDMVELDIRKTKDGVFVVSHDQYLGRLTTNSINSNRNISDLTYAQIKNERLKDPQGNVTREKIPTLDQALDKAKGKIIVNLDKIEVFFEDVYKAVKAKGMLNQAIFKYKSYKLGTPQQMMDKYGKEMMGDMMMTPIVFADNVIEECVPDAIKGGCTKFKYDASQYIDLVMDFPHFNVVGFEAVYFNENDPLYNKVPDIKAANLRVIQFPEWPESCMGNWNPTEQIWKTPNAKSIRENDRNHWGWLISLDEMRRPDVIISDRLEVLVEYLEKAGLRSKD